MSNLWEQKKIVTKLKMYSMLSNFTNISQWPICNVDQRILVPTAFKSYFWNMRTKFVFIHLAAIKNTINLVVYKQWAFISHHSRGWKVQDKSDSIWWEHTFWLILLCPLIVERIRGLILTFCAKILILLMTLCPLFVPSPRGFTSIKYQLEG